VVKVISWIKQ